MAFCANGQRPRLRLLLAHAAGATGCSSSPRHLQHLVLCLKRVLEAQVDVASARRDVGQRLPKPRLRQ